MKKNNLVEALNKMLEAAKNKLFLATKKGDDWGIKHYKKDIKFIESEIKIAINQK